MSTINGGSGLSSNAAINVSITTASSTVSSVIDLSNAVTLGDVARFIELGAPAGTTVVAGVNGTGLQLTTPSGTIKVTEVGEGTAAQELGILTPKGAAPSSTLTGTALNPAILNTTQLNSLLGTKAQGRIVSANANNDIVLTAKNNGAEFNNVRVVFVGDGTAGAETATYDDTDPNNKTLTVHVQPGFSTAKQVAAAITAQTPFTATTDYRDATSAAAAGSNPVDASDFGQITSGGSGEVLDTASGLIITNGGKSVTLDTSSLTTVEGLLNLINGAGLGVAAEINATHDGINVRSNLSGADLTIGENGGTLATQLGIRTYTGQTNLADLNRGVGVPTNVDPAKGDLLITARDGSQLTINLSAAKTVQDAIDLINNNSANNTGTTAVTAQLAKTGNGIELVDHSTVTTGSLTVQGVEGSQAAQYLGFVPAGQTQSSANTPDANGNYTLQSADNHTIEVDSVFNTLLRLKTALLQNDSDAIGRSLTSLDADISRVSFARSDIGSRLQSLDTISSKLQDENTQLKSALSDDMDADLVQAISDLTGKQYSLQASLQASAMILQLSLLNFI